MNSFIPWVGGKGKLLWIINKLMPDRYTRFIDVFGGSGTVTMCRPIQHGCMEVYCAASALTREGRRAMQAHPESMLCEKTGGDPEKVTPKLVTDCAKAGDPACMAVFDAYIEHLSSACASIYNLLDPEVLALGGGLSAAGSFLFDPLQDKVSKKCFYATRGKLVPAVLGNEAGMIGAALLARDANA